METSQQQVALQKSDRRQEVGMEKISGILPSSSRVASVDMREAAPVRPGTPTFGRPEGVSSLRDAKIGQTAGRAAKISQERLDWRSKDQHQAAMAQELSEKFFIGRKEPAMADMADQISVDTKYAGAVSAMAAPAKPSVPAGFDRDGIDKLTKSFNYTGPDTIESVDDSPAASAAIGTMSTASAAPIERSSVKMEPASEVSNPEGLYPRGSFVDVRA